MQDPDRDSSVWVDLGDYESQTYVHSYAYPVGATRTIQVPVDHAVADEPAGWRSWVSIGVDFIPVVGNIKSAIDATTGRDFIAGKDLGALERAAATAGIFAGGLSKTAAKGAMAGAVAVTEAVARRAAKNADEMAAKRPIVIGENMKDRVIPTATELNADYYKPRRTIGDPLRKNERWIDDKMREGRETIDIAPIRRGHSVACSTRQKRREHIGETIR